MQRMRWGCRFLSVVALTIVAVILVAPTFGSSLNTGGHDERDHELPSDFSSFDVEMPNNDDMNRVGRSAARMNQYHDWYHDHESRSRARERDMAKLASNNEPTMIRSYLAPSPSEYPAVFNDERVASPETPINPMFGRVFDNVITEDGRLNNLRYRNQLGTLSNLLANKRKRTCLINSGLSHDCDMKDFLAALSYRRMWDSPSSPGKTGATKWGLASGSVSVSIQILHYTRSVDYTLLKIELAKLSACRLVVDKYVKTKTVVGIGSGSTMCHVLESIKSRMEHDKLTITCVPSSYQAKQLIIDYGLPLGDLDSHPTLDLAIDGADEVDGNLVAIKGGGGCLAQEKVVASSSKKFVVVADFRKNSKHLGQNWSRGVPIEVMPMACNLVKCKLVSHGVASPTDKIKLRQAQQKVGPVVTDNGNFILDWEFDTKILRDNLGWASISDKIKLIPGVLETGIFADIVDAAYFGQEDGNVVENISPKMIAVCCTMSGSARDWAPAHSPGGNKYTKPNNSIKDRIPLRDLKSITLYRGRLTTGRLTHPIPQLTCVGGTAGCKLFTPQEVQCQHSGDLNWSCHADMSDRVKFNHIEVICEGYEYAEDDHVLLGSCGLEFTLDYVSPHDHHELSYFSHLDPYEKEMHHERVRKKLDAQRSENNQEHSTDSATTKAIRSFAPEAHAAHARITNDESSFNV
ncbi:Ribose-5-phosphate isomerase [Fragariocoptes setiger]|uniref:ribose-5-phosphate isomerase n=1 Tax=Fragariocoptes setiger TaxID=1670756 RepID=A0ABQ7SAU1_9ACAR|nr:Ribose-5-phosphate isomerase [Fragariocoptes setiger]